MAYVTVEDDTGSLEMLAFSNVLTQYGGYLGENQAVVITGRLSLRDDKEPQIVINRARPISDFAEETKYEAMEEKTRLSGTLYLKIPTEDSPLFAKVRAVLAMFPGEDPVVAFFADTRLRKGSRCGLDQRMLKELANILGEENVVLK